MCATISRGVNIVILQTFVKTTIVWTMVVFTRCTYFPKWEFGVKTCSVTKINVTIRFLAKSTSRIAENPKNDNFWLWLFSPWTLQLYVSLVFFSIRIVNLRNMKIDDAEFLWKKFWTCNRVLRDNSPLNLNVRYLAVKLIYILTHAYNWKNDYECGEGVQEGSNNIRASAGSSFWGDWMRNREESASWRILCECMYSRTRAVVQAIILQSICEIKIEDYRDTLGTSFFCMPPDLPRLCGE
jgi:hypothetical protein